jgi:hypothetical protein
VIGQAGQFQYMGQCHSFAIGGSDRTGSISVGILSTNHSKTLPWPVFKDLCVASIVLGLLLLF